jgi:hypothetical protein
MAICGHSELGFGMSEKRQLAGPGKIAVSVSPSLDETDSARATASERFRCGVGTEVSVSGEVHRPRNNARRTAGVAVPREMGGCARKLRECRSTLSHAYLTNAKPPLAPLPGKPDGSGTNVELTSR